MKRTKLPSPTDGTDDGQPARREVPTAVVDEWFIREVLPMEAALLRFLKRHWRQRDDLPDLRQDLYVKLYESAAVAGLPANTGAYVYACARNLLIDRARRSQVVVIETVAELESLQSEHNEFTPEHITGARAELRLLLAALDELPPRCREVVSLRKIEGLSQREIAARMGIAEGTVEKQVTLGLRALADHLLGLGVDLPLRWGRRSRDRGSDA